MGSGRKKQRAFNSGRHPNDDREFPRVEEASQAGGNVQSTFRHREPRGENSNRHLSLFTRDGKPRRKNDGRSDKHPSVPVPGELSSKSFHITYPRDKSSSHDKGQKHPIASEERKANTGEHDAVRRDTTRAHIPVAEMVSHRVFKCVVDDDGLLSKIIGSTTRTCAEINEHHSAERGTKIERKDARSPRDHERPRGGRSSVVYELEPLLHGQGFDVALQVKRFLRLPKETARVYAAYETVHEGSSIGLWGLDLHSCDLASFVGFPPETNTGWLQDGAYNDGNKSSWRCVYLDASLNRLGSLGELCDHPVLCDVALLDVSYNFLVDLDPVRELSNLQVLVASNNRLGSADILGELPEESKLHHVDASNNYISRLRAPRNRGALRHISKLRLANNNLELVEEDAAMSLASLEWLDISGNSLASVGWVVFLPALLFLDCSMNSLATLHTFAQALAGPPRLAEVVAEQNEVTLEPLYRVTVLSNCPALLRLDHRPVDRAALQRRLNLALEAKTVAEVRETADAEYHRRVEGERVRLEQRKAMINTHERRLEEGFQGYRRKMQLEVEECVAYAASLRMEVGEENEQGLLTPGVSLKFQQAIEKRHSESTAASEDRGGTTTCEHQPLSAVLRSAAQRFSSESSVRRKDASGSNPSVSSDASGNYDYGSSGGANGCLGGGSMRSPEAEIHPVGSMKYTRGQKADTRDLCIPVGDRDGLNLPEIIVQGNEESGGTQRKGVEGRKSHSEIVSSRSGDVLRANVSEQEHRRPKPQLDGDSDQTGGKDLVEITLKRSGRSSTKTSTPVLKVGNTGGILKKIKSTFCKRKIDKSSMASTR